MKGMPGRISAALGRDLLVQYRARYVSAALAALAGWGIALRFTHGASEYILSPAFLFLNTFLLAFSLGVRQTVCERDAGILSALDLTPLRPHEFLAARCASLGLIVASQNPLIALVAGKPIASWTSLMLGICGEAVILILAAFLVVAYTPKGRAIITRLLASLLLLVPPLLPFFGFPSGAWLIVHPLQGPVILLQGAFFPLPGGTVATAALASGIWIACLLFACRKGFGKLRGD
jgi:fluoroquinolone transport system permease protein